MSDPCPTCGHVEPEPRCVECGGTGWVAVNQVPANGYFLKACPHGCVPAAMVNLMSPNTTTTVTMSHPWTYLDFTPKEK